MAMCSMLHDYFYIILKPADFFHLCPDKNLRIERVTMVMGHDNFFPGVEAMEKNKNSGRGLITNKECRTCCSVMM